jgi:hypothetical protein
LFRVNQIVFRCKRARKGNRMKFLILDHILDVKDLVALLPVVETKPRGP